MNLINPEFVPSLELI